MAAHYGFRRMPFVGAGLDSYFNDACYEDAYQRLLKAIQQYQRLIVLLGEDGIGKTLLLRKLMHEASDQLKFLRCYSNSLNFEEILNFVSDYLWLPALEADQSQKIKALQEHLDTSFSQGIHIVLVIDDAHQMREHVLGNLLYLAQSELKDNLSLQILLSGSASLENLLSNLQSTYSLDTHAERIRLERLNNRDTVAFIHRQLETAGGLSKALFPSPVLERITHYAEGIPKKVNDLCHRALRIAYLNDQDLLSPEIIDEAVQELGDEFLQNRQTPDQTVLFEDEPNETNRPFVPSLSNLKPATEDQDGSPQDQTPSDTGTSAKDDPNETRRVPSRSTSRSDFNGQNASSLDQHSDPREATLQPVPTLSPSSDSSDDHTVAFVSSSPDRNDDQTVAFSAIGKKPSASISPSAKKSDAKSASGVLSESSSQEAKPQPNMPLKAAEDSDLADMETRLQPVLKSLPEDDRTVELKTLPEDLLASYQAKQTSADGFAADDPAQRHRRGSRRNDSPGLFIAIALLIMLGSSIAFLVYQRDDFAAFFTEITAGTSSSAPTRTESLPIPPLNSNSASPSDENSLRRDPEEETAPTPPLTTPLTESESERETMPPEETDINTTSLKSNGDMLLMLGDIASARLFYEAAVKAGDIPSLIAVGSTYDPVVLNRLGLRGFHADPVKAAEWYIRAREADAAEADKHLNGLRRWLNSGPSIADRKAEELKRLLESVPSPPTESDPAATADDDTSLNNDPHIAEPQIAGVV
jgi:type II secretory pathway predicted ATPase ExeA